MNRNIFSCKLKNGFYFLEASEHLPVSTWYPDKQALMMAEEWIHAQEAKMKPQNKITDEEKALLEELDSIKEYDKIMKMKEHYGQCVL